MLLHRRRFVTWATAAVMEQTHTYTGRGVAPPAKGHHFLHIDDFSKEELQAMLQTAIKVLVLHAEYARISKLSSIPFRQWHAQASVISRQSWLASF